MKPYSQFTDQELLLLVKEDNNTAFAEIYSRYSATLFTIAYNYSSQKSTAEEIVQNVFVSFWERRQIVDIDKLDAYLATACKFSVFKQIAREKRRQQLFDNFIRNTEFSVEEETAISARFLDEYINGIVEQLPTKCKLIYKLKQSEECSTKELADKFHMSPHTVRNHLHKARTFIRKSLKVVEHYKGFFF